MKYVCLLKNQALHIHPFNCMAKKGTDFTENYVGAHKLLSQRRHIAEEHRIHWLAQKLTMIKFDHQSLKKKREFKCQNGRHAYAFKNPLKYKISKHNAHCLDHAQSWPRYYPHTWHGRNGTFYTFGKSKKIGIPSNSAIIALQMTIATTPSQIWLQEFSRITCHGRSFAFKMQRRPVYFTADQFNYPSNLTQATAQP